MSDTTIQMPDGSTLKFPSGMSQDEMKTAIYSDSRWKKYAPAASPPPAPTSEFPNAPEKPIDRAKIDKYRMDYFNTDNAAANVPMQVAHGLAANPNDNAMLQKFRRMSPVGRAAINEKAQEIRTENERTQAYIKKASKPLSVENFAERMQAATSTNPLLGQAYHEQIANPNLNASAAFKGPEGARQGKVSGGGVAAPALNVLADYAAFGASPEGAAAGEAFGLIGSLGKTAARGVKAAGIAMGEADAVQRFKAGDKAGAAFAALLPFGLAAIHGAAERGAESIKARNGPRPIRSTVVPGYIPEEYTSPRVKTRPTPEAKPVAATQPVPEGAGRITPKAGVEVEAKRNTFSIVPEVAAEEAKKAGPVDTKPAVAPEDDLWSVPPQEHSSAATSINASKLPASFNKLQWKAGTRNADIGGGRFDNATEFLQEKGVENYIFDPFNRSSEHNTKVSELIKNGQSDTATVNNVLNVIQEEANRSKVIKQAANALKPDGVAHFLMYEGDKSGIGKPTKAGWQENRSAADYEAEIKKEFGSTTRSGNLISAREPRNISPVKANTPVDTKPAVVPPVSGPLGMETKIANEHVNAERARIGLEPLDEHTPVTQAEREQRVLAGKMDIDAPNVAKDVMKTGRAMTADENVANLFAQHAVKTDLESLRVSIEEGVAAGRDTAGLQADYAQKLEGFETLTDASKRSGTSQGQALQIRQAVVNDFSHENILQQLRMARPEVKVTPEETAAAKTAAKAYAEADKPLKGRETPTDEQQSQRRIEATIEQMKPKAVRTGRQTARATDRAALDAEHEELVKRFVKTTSQANTFFDPKVLPVLRDIARNRVKSGLITVDELVEHVHNIAVGQFPDATLRDVRDAISGHGYGSSIPRMTAFAALKRNMVLLSKIEDEKAGVRKQRGQAQPVPPEEQALRDELAAERKKNAGTGKGPVDEFKTVRTRLTNELADLQAQIDSGTPTPPRTREQRVYDAETQKLKDARDAAKQEVARMVAMRKPRPGFWQQAVGLRNTGMLTSTRTIAKVVLSHTMSLGADELGSIPTAITDALVGTKTGKRSLSGISPVQVASSVAKAATQGVKESVQIAMHGEDKANIQHLGTTSKDAMFGNLPQSNSKIANAYRSVVGNSHAAAYRTARLFAFVRSIQAESNLQARNEGLTGEQYSARVKELIDNPSETISANAVKAAEEAVFLNENTLTRASGRAKSGLSPFWKAAWEFTFPFQKVSSNIVLKYYRLLPGPETVAGIMRAVGESKKGGGMSLEAQKRFSETMGRQVTGASLMALGAYLANNKMMTGYGKRKDGLPEGSLLAFGRWWELKGLAPVGPVMAVGATLHEGATATVKAIIRGGSENPVTQTAETISGLMEANPTRSVGNLAGSVVPQGIADLAAQMDDKTRKPKTVQDYVKQRIPGLRQQVRPNRTPKVNKLFDPTNSVPARR
jgi:hypothetical protein